MSQTKSIIPSLQHFLQEAWNKARFTALTEIQERTIPLVLAGRDVIAESPTGTGKTLAYLLPMVERIQEDKRDVQAVILAPTRELVMQIHQESISFTQGSGIVTVPLIGGADVKRQVEKLKKHPQLIVGTPGRILELIQAKKLKMHEVKTIVIDEADKMLESSFRDTVSSVIRTTLRDRQVLLFSATIPDKLVELGTQILREPETVRVSPSPARTDKVEHMYFICEKRDKLDFLRRLVRMGEMKALVFVQDTVNIEELAAKLSYLAIPHGVLHGMISKTERETVMKHFREGRISLLVASDMAARGLDIAGITHVIHLDVPEELDSYIHRSGRTGRMDASGTVISLATKQEEGLLQKFSKRLNTPISIKEMYMGRIVDSKPRVQSGRHKKKSNSRNTVRENKQRNKKKTTK